MSNKNDVQNEILTAKNLSQDTIRRKYLADLYNYTKNDTILYSSAFTSNKTPSVPGQFISITSEDIQGFMSALQGLKGEKLDIIIHSPGGSLEVADQLVQYLRSKYKYIRAIVPQNAMSAATMLACACDEILMGKHSALGPIDPQITFPTPNGSFTAPAQSILDEFERAKTEILTNPAAAAIWINRIQQYPQGFLQICENTINLSKDKVAEWLDLYMFKDTEKNGRKIAEWLGDAKTHKTHGRPIGKELAESIGLKIVSLESDQELQEKVLTVYHATMVTHEITNCMKMIENHNGRGWFLNIEMQQKN
jgi:ATP-dependent protease ClpP protease subunit